MCRVWRNCRESRGRAGDVTVTSARADCSARDLDHTATASCSVQRRRLFLQFTLPVPDTYRDIAQML